MKTLVAIFLALILMVASASPGLTKVTTVRGAIEARYAEIIAAAQSKHWEQLRAILAPDYRSLDLDGQGISRDTEIAQDQDAPDVAHESRRINVLSLKLDGDRADVEQIYSSRYRQAGADGKTHGFMVVALSSDIWRRSGGIWVCVQTVTNQVFVTVDGKPTSYQSAQPLIA